MVLKDKVTIRKPRKKGEDLLNGLSQIDPGGRDAWDIETIEKKDQTALSSSTLQVLGESRTIITNLICIN